MKDCKIIMLMLLAIIYLILTKCKCANSNVEMREEFSHINKVNKQGLFKQALPGWLWVIIVLIIYMIVSFAVNGDPWILFHFIGSIFSAFN